IVLLLCSYLFSYYPHISILSHIVTLTTKHYTLSLHDALPIFIAFFIAWNDFVYGISLTSTAGARPVPAALAFFTGASQFEEPTRSEEHTSELQSRFDLVCRLLLENKNITIMGGLAKLFGGDST